MRELRPFFSYFGSKWRLAPTYPPPEHETLIEPFAGGAGYACRHYKRRVILVEKDPRIAALWRWLIAVRPEEVMAIPLFGGDVQSTDDMPICEEAKALVGLWANRGTSAPCRRPSKWARERPENFWALKAKLRVAEQVQRIRHWRLIEGSYEDAPEVEATHYVDPPYQDAGKDYRHGPEAIDFTHLADWCRSRRGLTIVCENEGASWLPFESHAYAFGATKEAHGARLKQEVVYVQRR